MSNEVGNRTDTSGVNDTMTAPAPDAPRRPCDDQTLGTTINGETQAGAPACDDSPRPTIPLPPADRSDR